MKKYYIVFDEYERGIIINALNDKRNALIKEGLYTDAVDEVLLKVINATNNTLFNNSVYEGSIDKKSLSDVDNAKKVKFKYEPRFIKALTENSDNPYDVIETLVDFDDTEDYSGE